jgi:hypothetical protein
MANIKISELTALTPPAAADELPVVDVSSSATKKTTVGEVVGIITGDVEVASNGTATISELPVSKLQDGAARQLLQTDAAGTGVEWASNIDIPGTLDVTGAATFDAAVGVGTSSPTENLTIYGNSSRFSVTGLTGSSAILLGNQNSGGANNPSVIEAVNGALYFGGGNSWSGGGTFDYTMTLTNDNKVGIGTTSPTDAQLYVNSSAIYGVRINHATLPLQSFLVNGTQAFSIGANSGGGGSFYYGTGNIEAARIDSSGRLLVGTGSDSGGALFQVNGNRIRVATAKTPASTADTGTAGEICWDADYIYVCTATNTWKRTAISTW